MKNLLPTLCLLLNVFIIQAQQSDQHRLVILQPTGEDIDSLPEMIILPDTAELYRQAVALADESFIGEIIDLYFFAQNYLHNLGELDTVQPAYLALTGNQGGFAKFGFKILKNGHHIDKSGVPYIDLVEGTVQADAAKLMSVTQLYPHEMGHVIYRLLSSADSLEGQSKNVDMHYFSIVTDYATAFNEGFSEHIENVARLNEPNPEIKEGIFADIEKVRQRSPAYIGGFEKDFRWPFRFGFYKATMLGWHQQYEDLKRYEQAMDGSVQYRNTTLPTGSAADRISFRNAGVGLQAGKVRNLPQLLATEGLVDAFFTHLSKSELQNIYLPADFYRPFLQDTSAVLDSPRQFFTPMQNQFLKYFTVLHQYVKVEYSNRAQLIDFIEGYIETFPAERDSVVQVFEKVTGHNYRPDELPPQVWVLVKNYDHRLLALDAFGGITLPIYTFDLNAAEVEDLLTIDGLVESEAEKIIWWRDMQDFFTDVEQVREIATLSPEAAELVISARFDQGYFDALPNSDLKISALLTAPLKHILIRALGYFLIIFAFTYLLFLRKEKPTIRRLVGWSLRNFVYWTMLIFAGLIVVFLSPEPLMIFLPLIVICLLVGVIFYRKEKTAILRSLFVTGAMAGMIVLSLI